MTILYILIPLFVMASIFFYVGLMLLYPEWVGIAGKDSQKTQKEQTPGSASEDIHLFKEISDVNQKQKGSSHNHENI